MNEALALACVWWQFASACIPQALNDGLQAAGQGQDLGFTTIEIALF